MGRVDFEIDEFLDVDVLGLIFKDRGVAFVDVVQAADVDFLCACHLSVIDVRGPSRIRKKVIPVTQRTSSIVRSYVSSLYSLSRWQWLAPLPSGSSTT